MELSPPFVCIGHTRSAIEVRRESRETLKFAADIIFRESSELERAEKEEK